MSDRNLTTRRADVFGDVDPGTDCRVCGRPVDDGRSKTCSDYCNNIQVAVMGLLNWSTVRRRIAERDDEICQHCGRDLNRERRAREHIRERIDDLAGERPTADVSFADPDAVDEFDYETHLDEIEQWRERREELKERYGDPYERGRRLEVDHVTPLSEGGHPFDPGNLQTLCGDCHADKSAREAAERAATPSAQELNRQLFEFVQAGGER